VPELPRPEPSQTDEIVVEVVRNGLVESVHRARVAITAADGTLLGAIGAVAEPMYPRSALKPLQTVAMVECGLDLPDDLLALVAASHSGEEMHVAGTRRILRSAGLSADDLQTPPDWPVDEEARIAWIRSGADRSSVVMNCSGKHAGMLATAVHNGWRIQDYRDPAHPVQLAARDTIGAVSGEQPTLVAVDGCGAPAFAISLQALARSFGRLATASFGAERRVADAIRAHPEMTSGTRRDEFDLHRALPGLVTKAGAEAVQAVGLPDGRGIAVKISDGTPRARPIVVAAILQRLGFDHPTLTAQACAPVLGHGEPVGAMSVRPAALDGLGALS
jgi:L-asparaginase II